MVIHDKQANETPPNILYEPLKTKKYNSQYDNISIIPNIISYLKWQNYLDHIPASAWAALVAPWRDQFWEKERGDQRENQFNLFSLVFSSTSNQHHFHQKKVKTCISAACCSACLAWASAALSTLLIWFIKISILLIWSLKSAFSWSLSQTLCFMTAW